MDNTHSAVHALYMLMDCTTATLCRSAGRLSIAAAPAIGVNHACFGWPAAATPLLPFHHMLSVTASAAAAATITLSF
eukprot:11179-Heterococcus_DN1.PRE.2